MGSPIGMVIAKERDSCFVEELWSVLRNLVELDGAVIDLPLGAVRGSLNSVQDPRARCV